MTTASEVMTKDPVKLAPADSLQRAAELMRSSDTGAVPVCEQESNILVGMITDRDIVIRAVAMAKSPDTTVGDVCTRDVARCYPDDDLTTVREAMDNSQIRRVPIVNHDQELVGIVSLADLSGRGEGGSADIPEPASSSTGLDR